MSDISREIVKCAKCGEESPQIVVYSVNYYLEGKENGDKLLHHKQKCPYCNYEAISIDALNNKLTREELEKITDQFIGEINKYEIFKVPNKLYLDYFNQLKKLFDNSEFEEDSRFVTYCRLDFLRQELTDRLHDDKLKNEDPNWKDKWDNRLGAFWDLYDYIRGDRHITPSSVPNVENFKDILLANDQYYKDGIICKQEKDILLGMINEMEIFIKSKQESSEYDMTNNSKKLVLKIEDHDWGLKTIYTWNTKTWYIYDNLSVEYEIRNGENKIKSYSHKINDVDLKQIIKNIELAKSYNHEVQAVDGEAWEFIQYENGNTVWERKLGYIYGIEPLENICDVLINLVRNDSDIFIGDEKEENNMGLFSKKDKYDMEAEDNVPQFVYGIPDTMRKQWEKEEKEQKEKYDIDERENRPQIVYGIPDSMRKKWAEEEKAKQEQENQNNKYDVDPYENMPREVYGIPDAMRNRNKYDIKPEDNMPQRVYGVPNPQTKYDIKPDENVPQKVYGVPFFDNKNTKKCPYCNSTELWKYLYGEPTYDYDKDKYVLGGCEITGNQPTYKCKKCGKDIYPESNIVLPKITAKKCIRIGIKNNKSNYVMLLNHYKEDNTYDISFADLNDLAGKVISDLSTRIPEKYFVKFIDRLYTIINNWHDNYPGESEIIWSVKIEEDGNNRLISGNGGFPENWDTFVDLLIEYEKIFKNAKKIEIEKIQEMEYNKLTLEEAISKKVKDPFWVQTIIKYFKEDAKMNDFVAKTLFKDLSKYDDILNEFTKYLNQKTYDLENAIEINGYTAKKIHELNPSFDPTGVYTFMELLRTDPKRAEEIIKGGFKNKDVIPPTNNFSFPNPFEDNK